MPGARDEQNTTGTCVQDVPQLKKIRRPVQTVKKHRKDLGDGLKLIWEVPKNEIGAKINKVSYELG